MSTTSAHGAHATHIRERDDARSYDVAYRTLDAFRNAHAGATIIVCGCGVSLNELTRPHDYITIGVNDVGHRFDPAYLVVVNHERQFAAERFQYVRHSRARAIFTQLEQRIEHPCIVRFTLGTFAGTNTPPPGALHYTQNSPYVAVGLAELMGAARIGLIGVDFTEHHFFARTGRHPLGRRLDIIDAEYGRLARALEDRGVELVNCSTVSRLSSVPRGVLR